MVRLIMQPFLIVKEQDLIFNLQNYCIIHSNLLGCTTTKRCGKTSPSLEDSPLSAVILSDDNI